jgi:two-component system LytT family sensor kinase
MKKRLCLWMMVLAVAFGPPVLVYAQYTGYKFGQGWRFEQVGTDRRFMVRQPYDFGTDNFQGLLLNYEPPYGTRIVSKGAKFWGVDSNVVPKTPILLGIRLDSLTTDYIGQAIHSNTKTFKCYTISNGSEAEVIAVGITPSNRADYLYHVVEDDSAELVPWSSVTRMEQQFSADKPYAYIGKYRAPGHQILVEVVNKKDYSIRDGVVFDWRTDFKPVVTQIIVMKRENHYFNINYAKLNCGYATQFDPVSGLPLDFRFPDDSVTDMLIHLKHHPTVMYNVYLIKTIAGRTDTMSVQDFLADDVYALSRKDFDKPGKYQLIIQRNADFNGYGDQQAVRLSFEVLSPPLLGKTISFSQLLPIVGGAVVFIGLGFVVYYRYNKAKLRRSVEQSERIGLQLQSIRSQLNPHFVFNALGSIQGLMNNNDLDRANRYLARFAELTRRVLNTSEQEMISLADEMSLLQNYMEMEQLRFGFRFVLSSGVGIDAANTEIPGMLLQPFVENAVKHGVAGMGERGYIEVLACREGKDLLFSVKDNGKGFDVLAVGTKENAFGIKLSRQQIALLNQRYGENSLSEDIFSGDGGTKITIRLKDWV